MCSLKIWKIVFQTFRFAQFHKKKNKQTRPQTGIGCVAASDDFIFKKKLFENKISKNISYPEIIVIGIALSEFLLYPDRLY